MAGCEPAREKIRHCFERLVASVAVFLERAQRAGEMRPDLDPRAVDRVVEDWHTSGGDVVAATYGGVRLHPVLLGRAAWASVPDEGARSLPARLVPCDDLTPPGDVDFSPAGS